jgi:hypothetical protein
VIGQDSFLDFTDGDVEAARLLRQNLGSLVDGVDDAALRRDIRAVLAGRMTFRELTRDPRLLEIARVGVRRFEEAWDRLTPEQRAAEVRAGSEREERTRAQ